MREQAPSIGAAPVGGWQEELGGAPAAAPTEGEEATTSTSSEATSVDTAKLPSTPDGLAAFLAEIDGPRPMVEGGAPDNAVASFRASDVLIAAGSSRDVPIPVWTADSTVTVVKAGVDDEHCEGFDVGFSIYLTSPAEEDSGGNAKFAIIQEPDRITSIGSGAKPALSFKVARVPSTVVLKFDNTYSWITSKRVLYHIEVKPPIDEHVIARSKRAELAIDSVAIKLSAAREGVSQLDGMRQSAEREARAAKEKAAASQKALDNKVVEFKSAVKAVKQAEQAMNEKEVETEENERLIGQMDEEKKKIEAYIEKLREELLYAESQLESKVHEIKAQHVLIEVNKKEANDIEIDIDNRLNAIEHAGAEIKKMEGLMKDVEEHSAETARELAIVAERKDKATAHMKFYERLFQALQLRLLEKPQEV